MFRRNLFKRVLPIILSMAMTFQSVPMAVSAAEVPADAPVTDAAENPPAEGSEPTEDNAAASGLEESSDETAEAVEKDDGEAKDAGIQTDKTKTDGEDAQFDQESQAVITSTEITVGSISLPSDFKLDNGESRLTYTVSYKETDQFAGVIDEVEKVAGIKVNGENQTLENYLTFAWKEVKKDAEGKETLAEMTGTPRNAGSYALHLETREQEGVCGKAEYDVYFNIVPAEVKVSLEKEEALLSTTAGSGIADFKKAVEKACSVDGLDKAQYSVAVKVYKVGETAETTDSVFNRDSDYKVRIEVTLDASIKDNYEVTGGEYLVKFSSLTETKVEFELSQPGKEAVKTYQKETSYKAADIAAEYVKKDSAVVKAKDKDGEFAALGGDAAAVPRWYRKEKRPSKPDGLPTDEVGGITQFYDNTEKALYTLVTEESVGEVGEYYLVYIYEGVKGQYHNSHSAALKFTIEPVEAILKPAAAETTEFKTGMTSEAINKTLAEMEWKLYVPDAADAALAGAEMSGVPVEEKDFYGVSYENTDVTQYYSPVFELVRKSRTRLAESQWPANATEDQKWTKWSAPEATRELKLSDEKTQYQYYVKFTGKKAVYDAEGQKVADSERPIAEATDGANRNYKVKADRDTLDNEKNMLEVQISESEKTTVDVSKIVEEFNKEGGRGKGGSGKADDPAWTIYDADNDLFADRASYKKAVVNSEVSDTHEDLTYTWQVSYELEQYETLIHMEKEADEKDEDFARRKETARKAFEKTFNECTFYSAPRNAGLYRLHIEYRDSALVPTYEPASGDVYFLIRQQELLFVADTQYAKYNDSVETFTKRGYSIYEVPDNDESKITEESRLNWSVDSDDLHWEAMNLKKNPDGSNGTEWEKSTGGFVKDESAPYTYKAAVWLKDGLWEPIWDADGEKVMNAAGAQLYWENYTTRNTAAWDQKARQYKQHFKVGEGFGDIKFDTAEIAFVVDRSKLFADKVYDGKAIAGELPAGLVKLTDKATGADIPATALKVNGEPQEGVGTVEVAWLWNKRNKGMPVPTEEARYGGTYTLAASFGGNDAYSALVNPDEDGVKWAEWIELTDKDGKPFEFTINPLEVELTPVLNAEVTAGEDVSSMVDSGKITAKAADPNRKIPDGAEEGSNDDRWLFEVSSGTRKNEITGEETGYTEKYPILNGRGEFDYSYYSDGKPAAGTDIIRTGRKYDVKPQLSYGVSLFAQYASSYEFIFKPASPEKINRGDAQVTEASFYKEGSSSTESRSVDVYTQKDEEGIYRTVPREGIPFIYESYEFIGSDKDIITKKDIPKNKNYIAVRIVAPKEFSAEENWEAFAKNHFVYANSIQSAGGYVIGAAWESSGYSITALFPVDPEEVNELGVITEPKPREFSITWEEGYTEKFNLDLTNAKVEANLTKAVAPKALAFNNVQSKLAVGEEQQLDVKITKAQLGDVVRVMYRLAGGETSNEYASINPETGVITALATNNKKPAPVSIEAYPVRLADDGRTYEEITGRGVKVAKAKVTVTEVTAPVIKKVIPKDVSAEVQFTKVDNGYRGEIYVVKLEDKKEAGKWKPAYFEEQIGAMKNGQWQDTFAIKPMYFAGSRGYVEKLKLCSQTLSELESGTYAVYARNVSAVRTLADGSKVTESAAGTVKTFATTKSRVRGLNAFFAVETEKTKSNPVRYYNGKDAREGYTVELADKSAQLLVSGIFLEKPSNAAADANDHRYFLLPLKAAEKELQEKLTDKYLDPKLSYFVTDYDEEADESVRPVWADDKHKKITNPSRYAVISNKGKLTLKGVDKDGSIHVTVWVYALDEDIWESCELYITAKPDTVKAKKVKPLKVGDTIWLADYLEYKQGRMKVPYYYSTSIEVSDENRKELESAGFRLGSGNLTITAEKAGASCDLKFTDLLWTSDSDERVRTDEMSIRLSSVQIDPVKGLKAAYVDDRHITLNFAHAGSPEAFDIEVTDARKSVVYKKLVENTLEGYVDAEEPLYQQNKQRAIVNGLTYFEKTRMYAYTISTEKLIRLSSYTISVTPVYGGEKAAKAAVTKAKTTNIPASYGNGDIVVPTSRYDTGCTIGNLNTYLTSGNTYTLTANVKNKLAQSRGTDTLTWKSSNTKVASVKPNQGSYSATLKALRQGKTTITVTSKVTKKTIARYFVAVKAVGDGSGYGGDYENSKGQHDEFYDAFIKTVDSYYQGRLEVLTVSNPVEVTVDELLNYPLNWYNDPANDYTWVQFTAPAYGEYTFSCNRSYECYYDGKISNAGRGQLRLEEGQKIYFRIENVFTLSVSSYTDFTKLTTSHTKDKPLKVGENSSWISFTAPEDNYYTFTASRGSIDGYEKQSKPISVSEGSLGLKAGETLFIKASANAELYVTMRDLTRTLAVGDTGASVSITKDNAKETQYVSFKADVTGEYQFTYGPADDIEVKFYAVDSDTEYIGGQAIVAQKKTAASTADSGTSAADKTETVSLFMEGGERVVIAVTAKSPETITDDTKKIDVSVKAATSAVKALAADQTVTANTSQMFEYTIPDDQAATKYTVAATESADVVWYYSKTKKEVLGSSYSDQELAELTVSDNAFTVKDGEVIAPSLFGKKSLKAGDKIYIKVEAFDKDSKVTLTSVADNKTFDAATPATVVLGEKTGDAEWYTFTVRKTGYYQFSEKTTAAPEGSAAQTANITCYTEIFGNVRNSKVNPVTSGVKKLTAGTYVFKISAGGDAVKDVKTTTVLSVKEIVPTVIGKGDTEVALAKDEVKYYSFSAATNDSYTIKWTPDKDTGTATAEYTTGDLTDSFQDLPKTDFSKGTCIIKLTQTGEKAVSGKLQIVADEKKFLTSGKAETFEIKENGSSIEYTFTTPEDSKLGYVVTVENTSAADETKGETMPIITVKEKFSYYDTDLVTDLGKGKASKELTDYWKQAFQNHTITVTASNVTAPTDTAAGISAAGKITIQPVTAQAFTEAAGKIVKADSKWYTYTVPADDRYVFDYAVGADQDKSSVSVRWYTIGKGDRRQLVSGKYLTKGQEIYVNVKAENTIAEAGVDVTVKTPAKLPATELTLTEGKAEADVTIPEGASCVYYTFKAPAYARYVVSANEVVKYIPNKYGDDWYGSTLEKDEIILIKVTSAGKLTVTQDAINRLELDKASEVTLKKDEAATFMLPVYADGYYDFRVSDAKGLEIDCEDTLYQDTENRCYFADSVSANAVRYEFTVTNSTEAEAKLAVTAGKLEPVTLNMGKTEVPVTKDRIAVTEFAVPESHWYTVSCSEGSELRNCSGKISNIYWWNDSESADTKETNVLVYSGAEAAATAEVTISKLQPERVEGEKFNVTLEAGEEKWYAYQAAKAGSYTFAIPENTSFEWYRSLSEYWPGGNSSSDSVRTGAGSEIYLKVSNNSMEKVTGDVTVTPKPAAELKLDQAVTTEETGYSYLTFTAETTGFYRFEASNGNLTYYGKSVWQNSIVYDSNGCFIQKGDVVYLRVYNSSAENKITVEKKESIVGAVSLQEDALSTTIDGGGKQWYTFTAAEESENGYRFRIQCKTKDSLSLTCYESGKSMDSSQSGPDDSSDGTRTYYSWYYGLKKGGTIYLCVSNLGVSEATYTIEAAIN